MRRGILVVALLVPMASAVGQGTIRGRAIDDSAMTPIVGAEVVVEGSDIRTVTDASGQFILRGITPRTKYALIRKIGFRPVRLRLVAFGAADTVEVLARMVPATVELAPVEVTVSNAPPGLEEFLERKAYGHGAYIDWTVLRQSEHRRVSDVLSRVSGVKVLPIQGGKLIAVSSRGSPAGATQKEAGGFPGGRCPMAVWLDGVLIFEPASDTGMHRPMQSVDAWAVSQFDAIEVYNAAQLPSRFRTVSSGCGAILFWTRRR